MSVPGQPCLNLGVCQDAVNGFTCVCSSGWTGTICDQSKYQCYQSYVFDFLFYRRNVLNE